MDEEIEKELEDVRRNLEIEVEQGTFPNIDLDEVIDILRIGIQEIKEGKGIPANEFMEEMQRKYLWNIKI